MNLRVYPTHKLRFLHKEDKELIIRRVQNGYIVSYLEEESVEEMVFKKKEQLLEFLIQFFTTEDRDEDENE